MTAKANIEHQVATRPTIDLEHESIGIKITLE
jgi:hypothetical protein